MIRDPDSQRIQPGGDQFGNWVDLSGGQLVVAAAGESGDVSSTLATPNNNAACAGAVYVFDLGAPSISSARCASPASCRES